MSERVCAVSDSEPNRLLRAACSGRGFRDASRFVSHVPISKSNDKNLFFSFTRHVSVVPRHDGFLKETKPSARVWLGSSRIELF